MDYGALCLVPVAILLVTAIILKDTFVSLLLGTIASFLILYGFHPMATLEGFVNTIYAVMMNEDNVWVYVIVAVFGALIALLEDSGGALGFAGMAKKFLKTRKQTLIGTWILGIIIFVDDYLNCLAVGAATRNLCDEQKISREMLAFIVNSTGVTVCAIVPISSWGAFMGSQMETSGLTGGLSAFSAYCAALPYVLYGWLAVIFVALYCLNIIPLFGPMKQAEAQAMAGKAAVSGETGDSSLPSAETRFSGKKCRAINFIIPLLALVFLTVWLDDLALALFPTVVICFILYIPQRILKPMAFMQSLQRGINEMAGVILVIILCYAFMSANEELGLTDFVINAALKALNPALLPVTLFLVIGALSFASGSFWGLAAIAFPIAAPLASAMGVNPFLCAGAIISGVCFGGHICVYSDTVLLTAASTNTTPVAYLKTSFPLIIPAVVISALGYLVLGFVL